MNNNLPENWEKLQISGFRDIREILNANPNDKFIGVPMKGRSLEHIHITYGDILITKVTDIYEDGELCVWDTPTARTGSYEFIEDAELFGIFVRVERDLKCLKSY